MEQMKGFKDLVRVQNVFKNQVKFWLRKEIDKEFEILVARLGTTKSAEMEMALLTHMNEMKRRVAVQESKDQQK